ncbi:MAG: fibronectin type III domain-containing protein [Planctomycetota bacterium]
MVKINPIKIKQLAPLEMPNTTYVKRLSSLHNTSTKHHITNLKRSSLWDDLSLTGFALSFIVMTIITANVINCNNNTPPPNASLNLTGKAVSSSRQCGIDLNWTFDSNSKINFKIERKTDPISAYNEIATVGTNTTFYSDTGLKEDTVYYYRIMAYDPQGHPVGDSHNYSQYSNEVSINTAISWILITSNHKPSPRYGHAMAYDSTRSITVLFGGSDWSDETWERHKTRWVLTLPDHKPSGRYGHAMTYESVTGKVVLFGGVIGSSTDKDILSDETWEWDGIDWTLRTPAHKPPGRRYPAMAYDSGRNKIVLFGGETDSSYSDETWEWDGTDWTLRTPIHKPSALWGTAMAYDSNRHKTLLYRGFCWTNELWEWNGIDWTLIKSPANSSTKSSYAMAYDSSRNRIVCIGDDETWEYDGTNWSLKSPENKPMPVLGHTLVYDALRRRIVLFGGVVGCYPTNDTWEWGY